MPGKNFIKIPSIFMVIGGAISIFTYLISGLLLSYGTIKTAQSQGWIVVALAAVYTLFSLLQFIAAAKGIRGCNRKEAADDLKKWGTILLIMSIIAGVINFVSAVMQGGSMISSFINVLFGLIFPVMYIHGASLNQKAGH